MLIRRQPGSPGFKCWGSCFRALSTQGDALTSLSFQFARPVKAGGSHLCLWVGGIGYQTRPPGSNWLCMGGVPSHRPQ